MTDFRAAEARFDLAAWCERNNFQPQGRRRQEWITDCPLCGFAEKLSVNTKTRKWRCFVCRARLSLIDLVALFEGSDQRAVQVILAGAGHRAGGIQFIHGGFTAQHDDRPVDWEPEPIGPPLGAVQFTQHIPYTTRRGFDLDVMQAFGVCYGLGGRYQERLIFPVRRWPDGAWLYFQSRASWDAHEQLGGRKYLKNLNPTADNPIHATAADVLLGLELVIAHRLDHVALVEGPTDALGVGVGAVASFGKKISDRQISLLVRAGIKRLDLCWDPDSWVPEKNAAPDRKPAAVEASERLSAVFDLQVVRYPDGIDPGSLSPAQNATARAGAIPYALSSRLAFLG